MSFFEKMFWNSNVKNKRLLELQKAEQEKNNLKNNTFQIHLQEVEFNWLDNFLQYSKYTVVIFYDASQLNLVDYEQSLYNLSREINFPEVNFIKVCVPKDKQYLVSQQYNIEFPFIWFFNQLREKY